MRWTFVLAIAGFLVWKFYPRSCGTVCDTNEAGLRAATEAGTEAAKAVTALPEGSMEREKAVIDIRVRETAIREAGYPTAADSFAEAAHKRLVADGVLKR